MTLHCRVIVNDLRKRESFVRLQLIEQDVVLNVELLVFVLLLFVLHVDLNPLGATHNRIDFFLLALFYYLPPDISILLEHAEELASGHRVEYSVVLDANKLICVGPVLSQVFLAKELSFAEDCNLHSDRRICLAGLLVIDSLHAFGIHTC
jgi:hypothetical protein